MKKIILFGGSFNPIHNGHLDVASKALLEFDCDEIWIIPSNSHPLKGDFTNISTKDRLELISLAIASYPNFILKKDEIIFDLKFSYDTIKHFKNKFPNYQFFFLMGSDNLYNFKKWYKFSLIPEIISIIVYYREGFMENLYEHKNIKFLDSEIINISSTEIRYRIKENLDFTKMLPAAIVNYIKQKKLYHK